MSTNLTYTLDIVPVGDHLQVTIPEFGIVVETEPGKMRRDDALDVALPAINEYCAKHLHDVQQKAS